MMYVRYSKSINNKQKGNIGMKRPYLNQEQRQLIRMNTLLGVMCALDLEYKKLLREVELTIKKHTNENTCISGRKV